MVMRFTVPRAIPQFSGARQAEADHSVCWLV